MTYGLEKHSTKSLRESILSAVDIALQRSDAFGTSLAYYGMTCDFHIDIELTGRQQDSPAHIEVRGTANTDDRPPLGSAGGDVVRAEGTVVVGKIRGKVRAGSNVREGTGTGQESPEQAAIRREDDRRRVMGGTEGTQASTHTR